MNSLAANLNSVVSDHEHGDSSASWSAAAAGWDPPVATMCTGTLAADSRFHTLMNPSSASSAVRQEWAIDWSENQMILAPSQYNPSTDHHHHHHHHHHEPNSHEDGHQNAVTVASSEAAAAAAALRHYNGFLTAAALAQPANSSCLPAVETAASSGCWASNVLINAAIRQGAAHLESSPGSGASYAGTAAAGHSMFGGLGLTTTSGGGESTAWMQGGGNNQAMMNNYLGHVGESRSTGIAEHQQQQQQQQRHSQYLLAGFGAGGSGMMEQQRIHDIFKGGLYNNCGGGAHGATAASDLSAARIGLNLGGRTYFSAEDSYAAASFAARFGGKRFQAAAAVAASCLLPSSAMAHHVPLCQAEGCKNDLSQAKHYHRRHKVCEYHSKASTVLINGNTQRFCQQCSRFHGLSEFDEGKRSCRKRLADHNRRRRKPQPAPLSSAAAAPSAPPETSNTTSGNISTPTNVDVNGSKRNDDQLSTETNNYNMSAGGGVAEGVLISTGSGVNEQKKTQLTAATNNLQKPGGGGASADASSPLMALAAGTNTAAAAPSVLLTLQNHGGGRAAGEAADLRSSASNSMAAAPTSSEENTEMKESPGTSSYAATNYFLSLSSSTSTCSNVAATSSSSSPAQRAAALKAYEEEAVGELCAVPWLRGGRGGGGGNGMGEGEAAMAMGGRGSGEDIHGSGGGGGGGRYNDGDVEEERRRWAAERQFRSGGGAEAAAAQQGQQRMMMMMMAASSSSSWPNQKKNIL